MHKVQLTSNPINSQVFSAYIYRMVTLVGFIISFLISHSSYALATNPGANCQGITGASQGSLLNTDYNSLVSAVNTDNYVNISGNASGSIPLQIKVSTTESSSSTTLSNFGVIESGGVRAINIRRTFPNTTAFTDVTLDFRNSITAQPIYLTNVALSAFDIDYANSSGNTFDDFIQITGVNQAGTTIAGTFQSVTGSNITFSDSLQGLLTRTVSDPNCPAKDLGTQCQGSVQFSQPVSSVKIRYSNTGYLRTSTNQEIDFRVDNYCYVPQYIFSGTVFDDNGGITGTRANATNADITTSTSPYANNSNYFNGIFNTSAPNAETGITGSTVKLVNCANNSTTYTTQSVIRDNAPLGEYQISIPKTTLANNTNLCLLESRTGNTYPIRTSNESNNVGFAANIYNYPNNNFGRVVAENAALVLQKYQFVNDCNASTLNYTMVLTTENPKTGFSMDPIIGNISPQQCIAYKIVATNRANLDINDFIMNDVLQKKGVNSAQATSIRVAPTDTNGSYATDSVAIGSNGTVKTNTLTLPKKTKRNFYFNTKYETTVNP
ncbi:hypothetical protein [Psychrobacter immobilis]|uniref:hypothetical protein n=1 Tax=Psychrobacter immobilis TaxID=498 RepID=UPI00191AF6BF|nr:hypothetical protein [Psychrobacter immobilis]